MKWLGDRKVLLVLQLPSLRDGLPLITSGVSHKSLTAAGAYLVWEIAIQDSRGASSILRHYPIFSKLRLEKDICLAGDVGHPRQTRDKCLSIECLFWMGTARDDRRSQYCSVYMQVWSVNSWSLPDWCVQARNRRVKNSEKPSPRKIPSGLPSMFDLKCLKIYRQEPITSPQNSTVCLHEIITGLWYVDQRMMAAKQNTAQRLPAQKISQIPPCTADEWPQRWRL